LATQAKADMLLFVVLLKKEFDLLTRAMLLRNQLAFA
tara:strand:- start:450 stop:560 length:111 start_codon:yes stop_codon:yes gene_type:complete